MTSSNPASSYPESLEENDRPRLHLTLRRDQDKEKAEQSSSDGVKPDLLQGALAGLIGGLFGSAAKMLAEKIYPPRVEGQTPPPVVLAEKVSGHHLDKQARTAVTQGVHWSFGPLAGAVYGAAVEYEPRLAARHGAAFGIGLNGLTHESLLPILGLAEPVKQQPKQERWSEASSHIIYGVVTETVRRIIRGR